MIYQAAPVVRVAVEPSTLDDLPQLMRGLELLNKADPFVEVSIEESGEYVVGAAGEVHLETCLKDLRERFAGIDIQASAPLVAFKETVLDDKSAPVFSFWDFFLGAFELLCRRTP